MSDVGLVSNVKLGLKNDPGITELAQKTRGPKGGNKCMCAKVLTGKACRSRIWTQ